jgi:hypothetical protein
VKKKGEKGEIAGAREVKDMVINAKSERPLLKSS